MTAHDNPGCLGAVFRVLGLQKSRPQISVIQTEPEQEDLPYRTRDDFLSPAEASFYRVLRAMVKDALLICPKVSLRDIFFVVRPDENLGYYNKIDRKHVDYLLLDPQTLQPVFAIELDDRSHQRPDRAARDEWVEEVFETAGLPLVRVPTSLNYNTTELAALFKDAYQQKRDSQDVQTASALDSQSESSVTPSCPKCGLPMILRTAQRGSHSGQKFYGCANYPHCREMIRVT